MNQDLSSDRLVAQRDAVWRACLGLAASPSYVDRADAARCLAVFAGTREVDDRLLVLARDPMNTYVTEATVAALASRQDEVGRRLVLDAFLAEQDPHTRDHMVDAIRGVLYGNLAAADELVACEAGDDPVRAGAATEILNACAVPRPDVRARSWWRRRRAG